MFYNINYHRKNEIFCSLFNEVQLTPVYIDLIDISNGDLA